MPALGAGYGRGDFLCLCHPDFHHDAVRRESPRLLAFASVLLASLLLTPVVNVLIDQN